MKMKTSVLLTLGLCCLAAMPVFNSATPLEGDDDTTYLSDLTADERQQELAEQNDWDMVEDEPGRLPYADENADNTDEEFAADDDHVSDWADANSLYAAADEQQAFMDDSEEASLVTSDRRVSLREQLEQECHTVRRRMRGGCRRSILKKLSGLKRFVRRYHCRSDARLRRKVCAPRMPNAAACFAIAERLPRVCSKSAIAKKSGIKKRQALAACHRYANQELPRVCGKWRPPRVSSG